MAAAESNPPSAAALAAAESQVRHFRLRYTKLGPARFQAHLDLSRIFARAARRAALPLAHTAGFHPQPKLSFGPPLQLGIGSRHEFVDAAVADAIAADELMARLNRQLPEGVAILECREIPAKTVSIQARLSAQSYHARPCVDAAVQAPALRKAAADWGEISVTRLRRHGSQAVKLSEVVSGVALDETGLYFTIAARQSGVLKPSEVLKALSGKDLSAFEVEKVGVQFAPTEDADPFTSEAV